MYTYSEENYVKAIYKLSGEKNEGITTNAIARYLSTKASSVTGMIKKLAGKKLVAYRRYRGVTLTSDGKALAVSVIRKHRLWESFLSRYLGFKWEEVHEVAEELEHIKSDLLTERLDQFMNSPCTDPHGDPIPDKSGNFPGMKSISLIQISPHIKCVVIGVTDETTEFLSYLNKVGIKLGTAIEVMEWHTFDHSAAIKIDENSIVNLSHQVIKNLLIRRKA